MLGAQKSHQSNWYEKKGQCYSEDRVKLRPAQRLTFQPLTPVTICTPHIHLCASQHTTPTPPSRVFVCRVLSCYTVGAFSLF